MRAVLILESAGGDLGCDSVGVFVLELSMASDVRERVEFNTPQEVDRQEGPNKPAALGPGLLALSAGDGAWLTQYLFLETGQTRETFSKFEHGAECE